MQREHTFHTFIGHDASDRDHSIDPTAADCDQYALIRLDALFVAFDDTHVYVQRVAAREVRGFFAGAKLIGDD